MRDAPFVGRLHELSLLTEGLARAREGKGSFFLISGPIGIGKTSLLKRLAQESSKNGFRVLSGHAMKDHPAPFFPFETMFRTLKSSSATGVSLLPGPFAPFLIFEEEKPVAFWSALPKAIGNGRCLVLSRERSDAVHLKLPGLDGRIQSLHLSRTEGGERLNPSGLDALGQRVEEHLKSSPGNLVAIANVEYLVVQNNFLSVLRLLQFLREVAEVTGGHLAVSVNPRSLDSRERALLESEGEVVTEAKGSAEPRAETEKGETPPALKLLNYLDRLETANKERPLLLTIDDLQWADGQSALALQFLARNSRNLGVLIVGAMRTEEREGMHAGGLPVNEALDSLARDGLLNRLPLAGLLQEDLGPMVEGLIGGALAPSPVNHRVLAELFAPSMGNPFFVLEMTESLMERGWLRKEGDRWVISSPPTEGRQPPPAPNLRRFVSQRLIRLTREERDVVEAAALIGTVFDMGPVAAITGFPPTELGRIRTVLTEEKRILRREEGAKDRWAFVHPFVWEMVLDEMPLTRSHAISGRLAEWWSKAHPDDVDTVARLYYRSVSTEKAMEWVRKAAEKALNDHNGDAMVRYSRWILALMGSQPGNWPEHVRESVRLAEGLTINGSPAEAERLLRDLTNTDPLPPGKWRIAIALADNLLDQMRPGEAFSILETTRQEIAGSGAGAPKELWAMLEIVRADFHMRFGDAEMGRLAATHALELQGEEGDPLWKARALDHLGWSLLRKKELDEAAKTFARGRELCERLGIAGYLAYHLDGEGHVQLRRGNVPGALKLFREASAQSRRSGDLLNSSIHLLSLVKGLFLSGKLEEAERTAMDSLKISEQFDYLWISGRALVSLGEIAIERKRWEEARERLDLAVNRFVLAGEVASREDARLLALRVRGELGDPKGALKELENFPPGGLTRYLVRARLRELVGDVPGAARDLERAWEESAGLGPLERIQIRREQARLEERRGDIDRAKSLERECTDLLPAPMSGRNP